MVINDFDVFRVAVDPDKANTPLVVDPNAGLIAEYPMGVS